MVILDPNGIIFDAVGVFGLAFQLLFKSGSSYCELGYIIDYEKHYSQTNSNKNHTGFLSGLSCFMCVLPSANWVFCNVTRSLLLKLVDKILCMKNSDTQRFLPKMSRLNPVEELKKIRILLSEIGPWSGCIGQ